MRPAYIAALVVLGLAVLAVGGFAVRRAVARAQGRKRLAAVCASVPAEDTVLLQAVSYCAAGPMGATLASAFAQAHCALRVRATVYEVFDPAAETGAASSSVAAAYAAAAAASDAPFVMATHVRCLRVPVHLYRGVLAAMEQLERLMSGGERYVCLVAPGTLFAKGWERTAVKLLEARPAPARAVLTCLPTVAGPAGRPPNGVELGTFVAAEPGTGALVSFPLKSLGGSGGCTPALLWSSGFSFCRTAARRQTAPYPTGLYDADPGKGVDTLAHDYYVTLRLLAAGWELCHPLRALAVVQGAAGSAAAEGSAPWRLAVRAANLPFVNAGLLHALGVRPEEGGVKVSARAALGLTPAADDLEVVQKMGSKDDFLCVLSRLELGTAAAAAAPAPA